MANEVKITIKGQDQATPVLEDVADALGGLGESSDRAKGKPGGPGLAGMGTMLGGPLLAGAAVAGGAMVGLGATALNMALDFDQANRTMQTQLGLTAEEARALEPAIQDVFVGAMVGTADEAALAIAETRRQLAGLADEDLANVTNQSLMLAQAMGEDQAKVLNTVNTLMTQFGLDAQQAMDFVAGGFQKGLNSSGDFLDSIGEYSTQFANGGADAGQFFSVLESGMQGGMLGTDKAADLFKEFRLRIQDGSDATIAGLNQLGLSWEEINAGLADGSLTVADAFGIVQDAIADTEDPTIRMQAGAALMGSQFEDLGDSAVAGISLASSSLDDMAGSTDSLGAQFGGLGVEFESTKRELMAALLPLGEELVSLAQEYMPDIKAAAAVLAVWLGENLPRAIEGLQAWWTDLNEGIWVVQQGLNSVRDAVQPVIDKIGEFGSMLAGVGDALPDWLTPGSPTPLELGLIGIDQALGRVARDLPDLEAGLSLGAPILPDVGPVAAGAGLGAGAAAGAGMTVVVNVAGSVVAEADLVEKVRQGLNEFLRRNTYAITG